MSKAFFSQILKSISLFFFLSPTFVFADEGELGSDQEEYTFEGPRVLEKQVPIKAEESQWMTGNWEGVRDKMLKNGFDLKAIMYADDTWNLHGGKKITPWYGAAEYMLDVNAKISSTPLFHYSGGTIFADYVSHHGSSPSTTYVGSLVPVDLYEAPPYDNLYALWYKQVFGDDIFWLLVGKSDAYDNFTKTVHSAIFLNNGYSALPAIPFFPTYPNPAFSVVASVGIPYDVRLTFGVFDGSFANSGYPTGDRGVAGRFFRHLTAHAFLIGEANYEWAIVPDYGGHVGVGLWKNTGNIPTLRGGKVDGTSGVYATFDQVFYHTEIQEAGFFFIFGAANPNVTFAQNYYGSGFSWKGLIPHRPNDTFGAAVSWVSLSKRSDFTEPNETSYELAYQLHLAGWGFLEPDFQYVQHPGGKGLPNAYVFTLRLQVSL